MVDSTQVACSPWIDISIATLEKQACGHKVG